MPAVALAATLAASVVVPGLARSEAADTSWANSTITAMVEAAQTAVAQGQVTQTLTSRANAVRLHDAPAFAATIAPTSVSTQQAWFTHTAAVPFRQFAVASVGSLRGPLRTGRAVARAELQYRLPGDTHATTRQVRVGLERLGTRWVVTSWRPDHPAIWDLGPVRVTRSSHVLVLGDGTSAKIHSIAVASARALHAVDAIWPYAWQRRATVVWPGSTRDLSALVDLPRHDLTGLAAVTSGEGSDRTGHVLRVSLNPAYYFGLSAVAQQIVLRHEFTHLAQQGLPGAGYGATPTWLREGLADYVGYRDSGVPFSVVAGDLLAQVRQGRVPAFPSDRAFAFSHSAASRALAYRAGWTACVYFAQRYGEPALFAFYRAVATGHGPGNARVAHALHEIGHTTLPSFTAGWQAWLRQQS